MEGSDINAVSNFDMKSFDKLCLTDERESSDVKVVRRLTAIDAAIRIGDVSVVLLLLHAGASYNYTQIVNFLQGMKLKPPERPNGYYYSVDLQYKARHKKYIAMIERFISQPQSLRTLSLWAVRKNVGEDISKKRASLGLPTTVADELLLSDLKKIKYISYDCFKPLSGSSSDEESDEEYEEDSDAEELDLDGSTDEEEFPRGVGLYSGSIGSHSYWKTQAF